MTNEERPSRFLERPAILQAFRDCLAGSAQYEWWEVAAQAARIERLLDDAACATRPRAHVEPRLELFVHRRPSLPSHLAETVLEQTHVRQVPSRTTVARSVGAPHAVYVLPAWLFLDPGRGPRRPGGEPEGSLGFLRLECRGDRPTLIGNAGSDGPLLRSVRLRARASSRRRRQRLVATARALGAEFEAVLGVSATDVGWLQGMLDDPRTVEAEGLRVWNDFVACCRIPESFRVAGRRLTLADLLVLRRGREQGQHRQTFAEQQPWPARHILDSPDPDAAFSTLDRNPANSIPVAAEIFCCSEDPACDKAKRFACFLPRHRRNQSLDRLLGAPTNPADKALRSLLLEAQKRDSELLAHIGRDVDLARAQIGRAIDVLHAYQDVTFGGFGCAYKLGTLLVRMMVRGGFDPCDLAPAAVATGLTGLSADSLAAFAAQCKDSPSARPPDPHADLVDAGVRSFLFFLGDWGRPRITAHQFVRFLGTVRAQSVHQLEVVKAKLGDRWPPPPGWTEEMRTRVAGADVRVLTSVEALSVEGREMGHCLKEESRPYERGALLGRLAMFSLRVGKERATLALERLEERDPGGGVRCAGWEVAELRGPQNDAPGPRCVAAADRLKKLLERDRGSVLPMTEIRRRARVQAALERSRTFNEDTAVAELRWEEIYRGRLPRSLGRVSAQEIVQGLYGVAD